MTWPMFFLAAKGASSAAATTAAATTAVLKFAAQVAVSYALGAIAQSLLVRAPKSTGETDTLIGLPVSNTAPGAPRVWAIGQRVRVPIQTMWMSRKVRQVSQSVKGKSGPAVREVHFDCAFLLNDRPTLRMAQLIMNDNLVTWDTLNLVSLATSEMTAAEAAGQVTLTMDSLLTPDFDLVFAVGDMLELRDFVVVSGPSLNGRYWEVVAVTGHTSTPSTMVLEPRSGQAVAGLNSTAGTVASPARCIRIDDALVNEAWTFIWHPATGVPSKVDLIRDVANPPNHPPSEVFRPGDMVRLSGFTPAALNGVPLRVDGASATHIRISVQGLFGAQVIGASAGTVALPGVIEFDQAPTHAGGYLPSGFVAAAHYYAGTETQSEDATIVTHEGAGNVGAFRGQAYQVLTDFNATNFGGALPVNTEAVIEPDGFITWGRAFQLVAERHGIDPLNVDTTQVAARPFLGYYLRGPSSGAQALQQLLMAAQVATQDRNGTLAFFDIDNADTVQINNGAVYSDFGANVGGPGDARKVSWGDIDERTLPRAVGVRFQDPASAYGENYEQFGLRNPTASDEQNYQELDFKNLAMTRKDARNLCATLVRRGVVNAQPVTFTLTALYRHVLENDLMPWTDDDGRNHLVRVTRVDRGTNFLVQIEAVVERANIGVSGSPVQSQAGQALPQIITPAEITGVVFDSPPVEDGFGLTPGVHVVCCAQPGSSWAGVALYVSQDDGQSYQFVRTIDTQHPIGTTTTVLAAAAPSETLGSSAVTFDTVSSVTVDFENTGFIPIVTVPDAGTLQGYNWFAVIDGDGQVVEVFGAATVVQNSATNYTFSRLLRGVRGTWQGCASPHAAGSRIVGVSFFYSATGHYVDTVGLLNNTNLSFKFVPAGSELASVTAVGLVSTHRNVQPFALRDLTKKYDAGTQAVTFTVANWTRTNIPPGTVGPYPLDEPHEAYLFTIYDPTGQTALRQITKTAQGSGAAVLRDPSIVYTAAEQTADGYTPGPSETFWVDVQQIGQYADSPSILQEI